MGEEGKREDGGGGEKGKERKERGRQEGGTKEGKVAGRDSELETSVLGPRQLLCALEQLLLAFQVLNEGSRSDSGSDGHKGGFPPLPSRPLLFPSLPFFMQGVNKWKKQSLGFTSVKPCTVKESGTFGSHAEQPDGRCRGSVGFWVCLHG